MTKFPSFPEIDFFKLRDEIISFTNKEIKHKDTFEILRKISEKYKLELNEVDEIGARKAVMNTRICVARFGLTKKQWKKFNTFFNKKKKKRNFKKRGYWYKTKR